MPYVVGFGDEGMYVDWAANQWTTEYSHWTGVPCIEAREPCSVSIYVDIRSTSQEDARPPPTEWHWSLLTSAPQMSLTWTPDAVLVSTMVWIVASPEVAKDLDEDGKLNYCCFGKRFSDYPEDGSQEPH